MSSCPRTFGFSKKSCAELCFVFTALCHWNFSFIRYGSRNVTQNVCEVGGTLVKFRKKFVVMNCARFVLFCDFKIIVFFHESSQEIARDMKYSVGSSHVYWFSHNKLIEIHHLKKTFWSFSENFTVGRKKKHNCWTNSSI